MEGKSSFVVRDCRSNSSEAEEETSPPEHFPTDTNGEEKKESVSDSVQGGDEADQHIPVNFSSFILSLAASALIHLGEESDPATGQKSIQLQNARQVIDLISLLQEKTKGNLNNEEERLVQELLYTLRIKFVALEKNHYT